MTQEKSPLQQYRAGTYDLTIAKLLQEQERKKSWLDEKLSQRNQPTQK